MLWARWDARAWFDITHNIKAKVFGEVRPGAVIGNNLAPGIRFHVGEPLFVSLLDALFERSIALFEISGIPRPHFREFVLNPFGNAQAIFGIEPIVRVAEGMDVALGAGDDAGGNLENFGKARSVKVACGADLNLRIGGLADEGRKPADFQLE